MNIITQHIIQDAFGFTPIQPISGISLDSRTIKKDNIFFCIKGAQFDGHNFVENALNNGASYVVMQKSHVATQNIIQNSLNQTQEKYIIVENVDDALVKLTSTIRQNLKSTVIGITGTAGKTSTKEQFAHAFKSKKVFITPSSYNTIYGLGLSICNLQEEPDYLVLELGINKPGEMSVLAQIANPDYSIITNVGPGHIGYFNNVDHIAKEKSIIMQHTQKIAFIPKICEKYVPSTLQYKLNDISDVKNIYAKNAYSILEIAKLENINDAAENIKSYSPSKGRNNIIKLIHNHKHITLIDSSFNCNPLSLNGSIDYLNEIATKRKIAILAEMKELGDDTKKYHTVEFDNVDILLLLGNIWTSKQGITFDNYIKLSEYLMKNLQDGDTILVKGSNATDAKHIVQYIQDLVKI